MRLQRYEKNTIWQNGKRIILRFEELGGVICWFNTATPMLEVRIGYSEVTPFCWTGLVNIVNCMHVYRHVVHIYLSILDRTHIKTQFNTIIIIVPDVFCQSF